MVTYIYVAAFSGVEGGFALRSCKVTARTPEEALAKGWTAIPKDVGTILVDDVIEVGK